MMVLCKDLSVYLEFLILFHIIFLFVYYLSVFVDVFFYFSPFTSQVRSVIILVIKLKRIQNEASLAMNNNILVTCRCIAMRANCY
jgi:hypothetical protein